MQTTFNVSPPAGMPGMPFDNGYRDVRSFPAKVAIGFGVLCELVAVSGVWEAQPVQDTGTTSSFLPVLAGVSLYDAMREQKYVGQGGTPGSVGYLAGEMVPFMRRGRLWVAFDGIVTGFEWPEYGTINVWHSSDGSAAQGVFTGKAAQTTLHSEIDAAPSGILGIEAALAQGSYTDGFGNSLKSGVVSLNLA